MGSQVCACSYYVVKTFSFSADVIALNRFVFLQAQRIAAMSVSSTDWTDVEALAAADPRIIPCYGIHPWKAHLHASDQCEGSTVASVLDGQPREGSDTITQARLVQVEFRPAQY
jgi:Tat protein secretion system quality control protein TatD with DNase activity